jgi:hypothetical protein
MSHQQHQYCHDAHGHVVHCPITLEPIRRGHEVAFNKQMYDRHAMKNWTRSQIANSKRAATVPHSRRVMTRDEVFDLHKYQFPKPSRWYHLGGHGPFWPPPGHGPMNIGPYKQHFEAVGLRNQHGEYLVQHTKYN